MPQKSQPAKPQIEDLDQLDGVEKPVADLVAPAHPRARGEVQRNVSADVATLFERHKRAAVATILRGLRAATTYTNKRGQTLVRPDFRERRAAAETVLAYVEGEPIKRQMTQQVSAHLTLGELEAKARNSPALAGMMRRLLDVAEAARPGDLEALEVALGRSKKGG